MVGLPSRSAIVWATLIIFRYPLFEIFNLSAALFNISFAFLSTLVSEEICLAESFELLIDDL